MKKLLLGSIFVLLTSCSSAPVGYVVSTTGPDTFNVEYPQKDLRVGDVVKIYKDQPVVEGDTSYRSVKKVIGEGKVSALLNGNFYEITTESAMQVPSNAYIKKY